MGWQYTPVTPLLLVSFVLSVSLTVFLLFGVEREGRRSVVFGLVGMVAGAAWWSATSVLKLSRTELSVMLLAEQLEYVGGTAIVVGWFVFAAAYTDRDEWLRPRVLGGVAGVLLVGTLLILTNGGHHLMWTAPRRVDVGTFVTLEITRRPPFFGFVVANYLVILAGIYALGRLIAGPRQIYRGQAAALVGSAVVPTLANTVTVFELGPWPSVDLSPIAFTISGALLAFAITRYELLDLEPVARRQVVQYMRDGFVVVDADGRIIDLNPAAGDLLGVDGNGAVGQELPEIVPEAEGVVRDDRATESVEFAVGADGSRYVEARLVESGESGGRLLLLQDVTERREVERRYQRLVEKASDVVFVLDEEGTITYVSPAIERVLGASPDDAIGEYALDLIHPEDRDRVAELFERGLADPDATYRFEFRVQRRDGEWTPMEGIGRNLLEDPYVEGIVVNARDITEQKERERELERQNSRLEEFASVVSHDLRNPLEVARGHLELARDETDEAERADSLDRVADAHDRMADIIDDVLTLAREGRAVTETEPADVETVAREAWSAVETDSGELVVKGSRTVAADPDRLRRLFENLFRNAVEHGATSPEATDTATDANDGTVTVTVGPMEPMHTGTRVDTEGANGFYVADDGPGLPAVSDDELFEFGYTTGDEGTGIGLAIVADIAEAHGWQVRTDESEDGGARFEFTGVDRP